MEALYETSPKRWAGVIPRPGMGRKASSVPSHLLSIRQSIRPDQVSGLGRHPGETAPPVGRGTRRETAEQTRGHRSGRRWYACRDIHDDTSIHECLRTASPHLSSRPPRCRAAMTGSASSSKLVTFMRSAEAPPARSTQVAALRLHPSRGCGARRPRRSRAGGAIPLPLSPIP